MDQIDRREALRRLSALVGGTLSASTVAAVLGGCSEELGLDREFETLTPEQGELVASMAEAILPTTDTPGARAAGVDGFIDLMLSRWMKPPEKRRFMEGLMKFKASFEQIHGKPFVDATSTEQLDFMEPLDLDGVEARRSGRLPLPFFATMKELVVTGYYTSEIGAAQELRYQVVFDKYDGDVDWTEGDRAFSNR